MTLASCTLMNSSMALFPLPASFNMVKAVNACGAPGNRRTMVSAPAICHLTPMTTASFSKASAVPQQNIARGNVPCCNEAAIVLRPANSGGIDASCRATVSFPGRNASLPLARSTLFTIGVSFAASAAGNDKDMAKKPQVRTSPACLKSGRLHIRLK